MARLFAEASSQYLEIARAVDLFPQLTLSTWFNRTAGTVNRDSLICINKGIAAHNVCLRLYFGNIVQLEFTDGSAGGECGTSTSFTQGIWNHACGIKYSSSSRAVLLNGGGKGTSAVSKSPDAPTKMTIGDRGDGGEYAEAALCDAAIWNIDLEDLEVQMLAMGVSPLLIRPENLVVYWPLVNNDRDYFGRYNMTPYNKPSWSVGLHGHPRGLWIAERPAVQSIRHS